MKEVFGWLPEANQKKLDELIKDYCVDNILEVGSFLGKSAIFFASRVSEVTCIDNWKTENWKTTHADALSHGEDFYDEFLANILESDVFDRIAVRRGLTEEVYKSLEGVYDLVYIDANHDYDSVKRDIENYERFATKIICGDDYSERWNGVIKAVNERYGDKVKVTNNLWYVIL